MDTSALSLSVRGIQKRFRGISVLDGVSFDLQAGTITGLIGANGAGKSTLLNVMTGLLKADAGEVFLRGAAIGAVPTFKRARAGLLRTFQHPRVFPSFSVGKSIDLAGTSAKAERFYATLHSLFARTPARAPAGPTYTFQKALLAKQDVAASSLSYGDRKLLMLAQVLAAQGTVFCFDELFAGLGPSVIDQVRECIVEIANRGNTVVFVEHNLAVVRSLATRVIFLYQGRIYRDGPAEAVLTDPEVVRLYLGD